MNTFTKRLDFAINTFLIEKTYCMIIFQVIPNHPRDQKSSDTFGDVSSSKIRRIVSLKRR